MTSLLNREDRAKFEEFIDQPVSDDDWSHICAKVGVLDSLRRASPTEPLPLLVQHIGGAPQQLAHRDSSAWCFNSADGTAWRYDSNNNTLWQHLRQAQPRVVQLRLDENGGFVTNRVAPLPGGAAWRANATVTALAGDALLVTGGHWRLVGAPHGDCELIKIDHNDQLKLCDQSQEVPMPRSHHCCAAFDLPAGHRFVLMLGGSDGTATGAFDLKSDVFIRSFADNVLSAWRKLSFADDAAAEAPVARLDALLYALPTWLHMLPEDQRAQKQQFVLTGGVDVSGVALRDMWVLTVTAAADQLSGRWQKINEDCGLGADRVTPLFALDALKPLGAVLVTTAPSPGCADEQFCVLPLEAAENGDVKRASWKLTAMLRPQEGDKPFEFAFAPRSAGCLGVLSGARGVSGANALCVGKSNFQAAGEAAPTALILPPRLPLKSETEAVPASLECSIDMLLDCWRVSISALGVSGVTLLVAAYAPNDVRIVDVLARTPVLARLRNPVQQQAREPVFDDLRKLIDASRSFRSIALALEEIDAVQSRWSGRDVVGAFFGIDCLKWSTEADPIEIAQPAPSDQPQAIQAAAAAAAIVLSRVGEQYCAVRMPLPTHRIVVGCLDDNDPKRLVGIFQFDGGAELDFDTTSGQTQHALLTLEQSLWLLHTSFHACTWDRWVNATRPVAAHNQRQPVGAVGEYLRTCAACRDNASNQWEDGAASMTKDWLVALPKAASASAAQQHAALKSWFDDAGFAGAINDAVAEQAVNSVENIDDDNDAPQPLPLMMLPLVEMLRSVTDLRRRFAAEVVAGVESPSFRELGITCFVIRRARLRHSTHRAPRFATRFTRSCGRWRPTSRSPRCIALLPWNTSTHCSTRSAKRFV